MSITDSTVDLTSGSSIDAGDLYRRPAARTDRHAQVRYSPAEIAEFLADGDRLSGGYCADPACGRFMTSPVHFQPGEAGYIPGVPLGRIVTVGDGPRPVGATADMIAGLTSYLLAAIPSEAPVHLAERLAVEFAHRVAGLSPGAVVDSARGLMVMAPDDRYPDNPYVDDDGWPRYSPADLGRIRVIEVAR